MKIEAMEYEKTGISEVACKDLLKREKKLTPLCDEISRHRRELLWLKSKRTMSSRRVPAARA